MGEVDVEGFLAAHHDELVAFRRHLHAHPELSGEEHLTTELIAERLRAAGLEPQVLPGGTGLVCDLDAGGDGAARVALRADIDALAMDDTKDVSYRSRVPGRAHGCGHDVHTTMVLGAGLALAGTPLAPRVRLIFEPSEETVPGGSLEVIAAGGLDGVDAIYGFHCDPKLTVGRFGLRAGPLTAATDALHLTLRGPGGHTARPHLTVDLVAVAGRLAAELPAVVREVVGDRGDVLVVFGAIHAGEAPNVIPTVARLSGSVRIPDRTLWDEAETILTAAIDRLVGDTGVGVELDYVRGIPPVHNDAPELAVMERAVRSVAGDDAVTEAPQSYGGDTFAWYQQHVPGAYVRIGVRGPDDVGAPLDLHSGAFDVDESVIGLGVRVLVAATLERLG